MQSQFRTYLISIPFILIIAFPFLNDRLNIIGDIPSPENRKLAAKPDFNPALLDPYPAAFENYYNDTFALRSRIIKGFQIYNCLLFEKSPVPDKVIIGKHKWLYLASNDINAYLGKERFSEKELLTFKKEFERRKNYLESKGCKFYIMIAPGKANVYPENIPYAFHKLSKLGWGEQLIDYLKQHSNVNMIDLFSGFKKIKSVSDDALYYAIDHHWNHLGAFHAANVAVEDMSKDFHEIKPLALSDFNVKKNPRSSGTLKQVVGDFDMYQDVEYELRPFSGFKAETVQKQDYPVPYGFPYPEEYEREKEIKGSHQPRLLVFCDSFGGFIFPFLSENFSRTTSIFNGWSYTIDKNIVEKEKPDVVLLIVHEPLIRNIFDNLTQ